MFGRSASKQSGFTGASGGRENRGRDQIGGNLRELGILGSLSSESRSLRSPFKRNKQRSQPQTPVQSDWDSGFDLQPSFPEKSEFSSYTTEKAFLAHGRGHTPRCSTRDGERERTIWSPLFTTASVAEDLHNHAHRPYSSASILVTVADLKPRFRSLHLCWNFSFISQPSAFASFGCFHHIFGF